MSQLVLLGDEAVAQGAIDAGVSIAYGYPGTPSTEILEYLLEYYKNNEAPIARWCSNEKTAFEAAVGVSLAGKRSLITMKHVGLNVAADAFMNAAILNIFGGIVLAVADDPGQHSSQSEQDSRYYADFARIICLEPRNQQEAYEMTQEAFELSERFHIPVMVKLVTRLAHSRAVIQTTSRKKENPLSKSKDTKGWVTLPSISRELYRQLIDIQEDFLDYSENTAYNPLFINPDYQKFGVITTGLARNYYEENLGDLADKPSHLHIGVYPFPVNKVRRLAESVEKIVVIEEGYPFVERYLRGLLPSPLLIDGKENHVIPPSGEINPDNIKKALGIQEKKGMTLPDLDLPQRPPQLCAGCPHIDTFEALNEALNDYQDSLVTSDIGCYTLGYLPPYNAIESCLCMGGSITMAKGAADAGLYPVVATLGDSTFLHSGITGLIDCVSSDSNLTVIIMDNSTTAMTGGQDTLLTSDQILKIVKGVVKDPDHIRVIYPHKKNKAENVKILKDEIAYPGLSVIIPLRECVQTARTKKRS